MAEQAVALDTRAAGAANLDGKVVLDVSNPLDFSTQPPSLSVSNTDSLAEQLQRAFPGARVVKALNTMWNGLMVNPRLLPEDHVVFVSGDDAAAKATVGALLREMGWQDGEILDLGDITTARGTEAWLLLWLRIWQATGSGAFNLRLVRAPG